MDRGTDRLDSADFDLEDAINELCPHESSSASLPLLQILLRQRLLECTHQTAILRAELQAACDSGDGQSGCIENIQEGIGALLTTLSTIRSSSTEAQSVVESITKEIRTLDLAKLNIESAIAGLKRLGMLVNAFDQLTRLAKGRKYRETASALQAVQSLSVHLDQLASSVPRVASLFKALQETQGLLRRTIMEEFSTAFEDKSVAINRGQLADSCLVIDALGPDARGSLIDWYTTFQLREYRRIFSGASSEAGQLDNISRRYAWFRRTLKSHEEDPNGGARIFPESWMVQVSLCGQFGEATREDLKDVLARSRSTLKVDVLLQALQITTTFEREMSQRFEMPYEDIAARSKSAHVGNATPIRTAFEAYLGIFVDAQDSALSDMFNQFRSSIPKLSDFVDVRPDDRPSAILPSSMELFHFYRSTLDRCAALTTRKPFLDLCEVYKKWLKVYSEEILSASLSGAITAHTSRPSGPAAVHESSNFDSGLKVATSSFLLCACAILNTANYCAETADQLQTKLQDTISQDFKSQVTLDSQQDLFRGNISSAISALLKEYEDVSEMAFTAMVKLQWKEIEFVSAESAYVHDLIKITSSVTDLIKMHVEQKKYVRSFCDKVVGTLVSRFTRSIVRCRPITPIGAEQMILDLQVLKNHLLLLPRLEPDTPVTSSYTRYLTKSIGKLDTLLKVIMSPVEPPDEFVKHYLLLVPCQSFSDFQKVLDFKVRPFPFPFPFFSHTFFLIESLFLLN
ncbi:Vacuolar protein sorting-associated protein 53, variant 2 [Puccinia graminis f. sp. tritici]|uniref:Vacuolar protein sorting-associated protein 53, variant 2 n=2 Tax=Puccinia graminis f. sp. tritici TaxID=56615 RepID=A0A5B0SDP3_PUCGR|nr:Vacuolar protein sorting-associated protein 53, variant 2 [Puccinia graminis f. sp. tritici]KAA1136261.1 Vacuolar protein sorting-associated protein 53, variant 2 [Puccinia graminis f. sp. tritici]